MKVLYFNRPFDKWLGGDAVQVQETMTAMKRAGIECIFDSGAKCSLDVDLVHVFHLNFPFCVEMYERLISERKPYVISAIFFPQEYGVNRNMMRKYAKYAKKIICLSNKEKQELVNYLEIDPSGIEVIPNGVDKSIFNKENTHVEDYVIGIGRLNGMKGALYLINACHKLGFKLRYVSSNEDDPKEVMLKPLINEYYLNISKEEVANLLKTSRVFAHLSLSDRQALVCLEAAACGLPVVDTIYNRGNDLLPSSIIVDPNNETEVKDAILKAWNAPRNDDNVPSWDDVAERIISIYKSI